MRRRPGLFDLYVQSIDGEARMIWQNDAPGFLFKMAFSPDEQRVTVVRMNGSFDQDLFEIDLVTAVHVMLPEHHLLDDALVDRRTLRCSALRDHLWCRPIDIAGLLSARTYSADGIITLAVDDPLRPEWGGRFRLEAVDGKAECRRLGDAVDDAADGGIGLGTAELGSVVLGGGSFRALARSGRVHGSSDDLAVADAMFDADPPPWTDTKF